MKLINFIYNHTLLSFIILFFVLLLIIYNHLIFDVYIKENKLKVVLNIRTLFKLVNIKIQLYPSKKKQKKQKKNFYFIKLLKTEYASILVLVKKLKIIELYSELEFGNNNFYITVYTDTLINIIYANIANIIKCKRLYLNFKPNFLEKKMEGKIKIHIRFNVLSLIMILPTLIRILKHALKLKEGDKDECNKFNSKYYGDNFGNN